MSTQSSRAQASPGVDPETAPPASTADALPPHAAIIQMASALVVSRALYVVAELGVADHLADGPRSADELAQATGAHAPSLYRVLRSLASLGVFTEDAEHRFALTPLGAALRSDAPGAARSSVRTLAGPLLWASFGEILHSVRTGEPGFERALGKPFFEYLSTAPAEAEMFGETMLGFHGAEPPAVAAAYDFSDVGTLVDVGGGIGTLLATVLQAHPGLRGVLLELPHVVPQARQRIAAAGLSERCTVVEGDFFQAVPPGGDAYMLSHIIHDWDEARCQAILTNCRRAMNGRGRLLLVEAVLPPGDVPHPAKLLDLVMLNLPGGRERSESEYRMLLDAAGFTLTRVVPTHSQVSVIEAIPA
ncbi:MAG TPA: methyltransferase [Longimicrobiaceae bacterium]|nr:methyltransferase [Longimicrobiaceae bacterium]